MVDLKAIVEDLQILDLRNLQTHAMHVAARIGLFGIQAARATRRAQKADLAYRTWKSTESREAFLRPASVANAVSEAEETVRAVEAAYAPYKGKRTEEAKTFRDRLDAAKRVLDRANKAWAKPTATQVEARCHGSPEYHILKERIQLEQYAASVFETVKLAYVSKRHMLTMLHDTVIADNTSSYAGATGQPSQSLNEGGSGPGSESEYQALYGPNGTKE